MRIKKHVYGAMGMWQVGLEDWEEFKARHGKVRYLQVTS